jgi:nucleoside-diphosphate-sugar epimerase
VIAVTGQNGDIGSILLGLGAGSGVEFVSLDNFPNDSVDLLVHMAAKSPPTPIGSMIASNIVYTSDVIARASDLGISKALFFSAVSVYGAQAQENITEEASLCEPDYYGATKYLAEKLFAESHIDTICLRLPAVLGYKNKTNIIARLYGKLKNGEQITLFNANRVFNNFIDVESIFKFITTVDITKDFDILNLAARQEVTLYEIALFMKDLLFSDSGIVCLSEPKPFFNISTKKAQEHYGFSPPSPYEILEKWIEGVQKI